MPVIASSLAKYWGTWAGSHISDWESEAIGCLERLIQLAGNA